MNTSTKNKATIALAAGLLLIGLSLVIIKPAHQSPNFFRATLDMAARLFKYY